MKYKKSMKKKFISLENIIRFLDKGIERKVFFNIELLLKKEVALNNQIYLELYLETKREKKILLSKIIEFSQDKVIFKNSHEDPTVEINGNYCFAMTIERQDLKNKMNEFNISENDILKIGGKAYIFNKNNEKEIVLEDELTKEDIPWNEIWSDYLFTEFISDYKIKVNKDAILTFHMNNKNSIYKEETKKIKKNEIVDFESYLEKNTYLGIQFSINDPYPQKDLDIEEKYVVKGQKGMFQSNLLVVNSEEYYPNILFNKKFLSRISNKDESLLLDFKEINNIDELILFYTENKNNVKYFEMDANYLLTLYKEKKTYTQSGVFSTNKKSNFFHIDQNMCKNCEKISRCIQNVPSNLSESLLKKIILIEEKEMCKIYNVL